jgi:hypothetical protein
MKKLGGFLLVPMIILAALALLSAPVVATVVTLDGVANAGWSNNLQTYLYVATADSSGYYYQWNYNSGSQPWTSVQDLNNDLSNNVLDKAGGITVGDWKIESGGNAFNPQNNGVIWKTLTDLSPGWYSLRLTSDSQAYNLKDYKWPKETPDLNVWNAYVQIDAKYSGGGSYRFNFGKYDYWQSTEAGALQYYRANVDGLQIYLADTADLRFYINDSNSVDNAGSVSLEFNPVPLPGSLYLLGPGLAFLLARRFKLRA